MLLATVDACTLAQVLARGVLLLHRDLVRLVGRDAFLVVLDVTGRLLTRALVVDQYLLIVLEGHLVGLLHHGLPFVQATRLIVLQRLLALVLEYHAGVHVALVDRNALRLILLPEIVGEDIVVAVAVGILAVLAHLCALHLLVVNLDLLLVAHLVVVAVVLGRHVALDVVVWELRLYQIHLRAELSGLPQLGVALRGDRATQRLTVLVLKEPCLTRALAYDCVDLLTILVVVEGSHVLLWVFVRVGLPYLNYGIPLGSKGRVVRVCVLRVRGVQ